MCTTMCTTKSAVSVAKPEAAEHTKRCYFYGYLIIANIPAITSGMMIAWSSPVLVKLKTSGDENPLGYIISTTDTAIIGSALSFGAIVGPFLAAWLPEKIGRKYTLISLAITFIIGLLTLSFARHVYLYYAARLVIGLAYGSVYTVLPSYLVEFAGNTNRGAVINTTSVCTFIGSFLALSIGPFTSIQVFSLICAVFPMVFIFLFLTLMPDTPQDLLLMGNENKAKETYLKMKLGNEADFQHIKQSVTTKTKAPYSDILKVKSNLKAMGIIFGLVTFKQFSGVNVVASYIQIIFNEADGDLPSEIPPIIIEFIMIFSTLMVPLFVERNGRKFLLYLSSTGMAISFTTLGVYFYLDGIQDVSKISWLPIISMIGCKVSYSLGFGSVTWILLADLMPYNVKQAASAITNSSCWTMLFIVTFAFPIITDYAGMAASFWIFAVLNFVALMFAVICVPETKGKSPQQIQEMLSR